VLLSFPHLAQYSTSNCNDAQASVYPRPIGCTDGACVSSTGAAVSPVLCPTCRNDLFEPHRCEGKEGDTYPLASTISLEIFIFLVVPLYSSSRLHDSFRSIASAFTTRQPVCMPCPSGPPPNAEPNISSPKMDEVHRSACQAFLPPCRRRRRPCRRRGWTRPRTPRRCPPRCAG